MNAQYKKGVMELCVLALLQEQDRYGYEISELISTSIDISDGTVYPILRKLKNEGVLMTYLQEESGGPPRKYYRLTDVGQQRLIEQYREYCRFAEGVNRLLKGVGHD